jgi:hypothetical protein
VRERRRALLGVVKERNRLVHRPRAEWHEDSAESGRDVLQRLEDQHQSVSVELQRLREDAKALDGASQELAKWLRSAEGKRLIREMLLQPATMESDPN